jgi:uncharacterized membrane protein YhaH (DUF805 family)
MDEDQSTPVFSAAPEAYVRYVPGQGMVFASSQEELDRRAPIGAETTPATIEPIANEGLLPPGAAATTVVFVMLMALWAFASRSETSRKNRNAFFEASISGLSECLDFWGRTSRADYWRFQLFGFLVCGSVSFVEGWMKGKAGIVGLVVNALFWIPGISLSFRRRHDLGLEAYPYFLFGFAVAALCAVGVLESNQVVMSIAGIALLAWFVWWLFWAFKAGDQDENRFGPTSAILAAKLQSPILPLNVDDTLITSDSTPLCKSAAAPDSELASRAEPTDPYKLAGQEILTGKLDASAWARALVEGNGVDGAVRAAYVKLRVGAIQAEPAQSQNSSTNQVRANSDLVKSYAASHSVTLDEAQAMVSQAETIRALGIKKEGEKYFFMGKSDGKKWLYDKLTDAIWAAERDL